MGEKRRGGGSKARASAWWALVLAAAAVATCAAAETTATSFTFELPEAATTSAGVYDLQGRLIRTLWRGVRLAAGSHVRRWDGLDDAGIPNGSPTLEIRLIRHNVVYRWEGVVGNSLSAFDPAHVHKSFLPPSSLVIVGDQAYYAVGYNERQSGIHGFRLEQPSIDTHPADLTDPFSGISMLATDGKRLYWANTGGLSHTSFVGAFDLAPTRPFLFAAGEAVCLNRRTSGICYEDQDHRGVIDVHLDGSSAPTGLAVQANGPVLAVAHGAQDRVDLFDKVSGAKIGSLRVALAHEGMNQLAMAPGGDLWIVARDSVLRYSGLAGTPRRVASLNGLDRPLAIAVSPNRDDVVWVADGGGSQQVKRMSAGGPSEFAIGARGGYASDPAASATKLCFEVHTGLEQTALAVAPDESLWVLDTCNNRMLHVRADGRSDAPLAYLPTVYASTVDPANPARVFANFLEFEVDYTKDLSSPHSWKLVRNWLPALPPALIDADSANWGWSGFRTVETLRNSRTYALLAARARQVIVELPEKGPLRIVKTLAPAGPNETTKVLYENGDLGYAVTSGSRQAVMRLPLTGFDATGDPVWSTVPDRIASVPTVPGSPYYRGAFSGVGGPRFPITGSGKVVFFDQSVSGNEGFHLGAALKGGSEWLWQASPTGQLDGRGSFQTKAVDGSINYGGNIVWAFGENVIYGYHGEFYKDLQNQRIGQANQFMHFHDDGLFIGQFGSSSTQQAAPGMSGNAFSPTLVHVGSELYLYHNDESTQGGIHRWRIDGWQGIDELTGRGAPGGSIALH